MAVKRALVSVYDKADLVPFVKRLVAAGWEIVSSGGTSRALSQAGIDVTSVEEVTGAPEILGGRVKTLHPSIHGGILARGADDDAELEANDIGRFGLVVCNLYPFRETLADPEASEIDIIEKIDIGGPAMVRAAAKNHRHVGVVVSPRQYDEVATAIETGGLDDDLRRRLAAEAFFHTASYDAAIVGWISDDQVIALRRLGRLRYGENPHQPASVFGEPGTSAWWAEATQHQGKDMSFNNYADTEAAWRLAGDLGEGAVVVVKHTNAAGAARGDSIFEAFERAWDGDSLAAFGGVIAINGEFDEKSASALADRFVEVVVARSASEAALGVMAAKKNVRVLTAPLPSTDDADFRRIEGGFLVQERDRVELGGWETMSEREPSGEELASLRFAWVVAAHTKSNAIVIAAGEQAVGVGAGDQSRVGAAERAVAKAGDRALGAVAASDAFFPFRDGLDALADAGVTAIVEPGGSLNDLEVIDAANERGLALLFANRRHFRH
ncbi:MAG TPA: bifunctional phosphoribosylaminoimidazolecarboxamide formyltransferase/IMP cyclohydrolase [Acidimicrobiia bacterium]